mmetsp:Transcript_14120/g.36061  ORF Transcript_14120/g.36061 Transcript_14120/m.36061 type:complete len:305 (-) Transcript_14120:795-1709(-)
MALGGVATGNMNAIEQHSVPEIMRMSGFSPMATLMDARMGSTMLVVATLDVNSVVNVMMQDVHTATRKMGSELNAHSMDPMAPDSPLEMKPRASAKPPPNSRIIPQGICFMSAQSRMRRAHRTSSDPSGRRTGSSDSGDGGASLLGRGLTAGKTNSSAAHRVATVPSPTDDVSEEKSLAHPGMGPMPVRKNHSSAMSKTNTMMMPSSNDTRPKAAYCSSNEMMSNLTKRCSPFLRRMKMKTRRTHVMKIRSMASGKANTSQLEKEISSESGKSCFICSSSAKFGPVPMVVAVPPMLAEKAMPSR